MLPSCELHLQPLYFSLIAEGKKTVEGRVAKEKYRALHLGDVVRFCSQSETLDARIISIEHFDSFAEMLSYYGVKNCLPGIQTLDEAVSIYHGFPEYQSQAEILGVMGIEVQVINQKSN